VLLFVGKSFLFSMYNLIKSIIKKLKNKKLDQIFVKKKKKEKNFIKSKVIWCNYYQYLLKLCDDKTKNY
jgi:hypothetical protein